MNSKYYGITIYMLVAMSITLVFLKTKDVTEDEIKEVNYIGDMEQENQGLSISEDIDQEEELLEIGSSLRVLIKGENFENLTHDIVTVSAPSGLTIQYGDTIETVENNQEVTIEVDDERLLDSTIIFTTLEEDEQITIISLERNYGNPTYYGSLEIYLDEEQLVIVNEVDLEEYLRGVLPSEMPSSYEYEALKAQAVCARSYAYCHMYTYNYPEYCAHIDDSTSYQVYNNLEESDRCNQAIEDTAGEKLTYQGEVINTYFFSTSCGYTTTIEAWLGTEEVEEEGYEYLQSISVSDGGEDFEADLPWYSWSITISQDTMFEMLYENLEIEVEELVDVSVSEIGAGGVVLALEVVGEEETTIIEGEYSIRKALGSSAYKIVKNDGTETAGMELLPSAFFTLEYVDGNYVIEGGGLGHGIGLSQNGANEMAKEGYDYREILEFFYTDVIIEK